MLMIQFKNNYYKAKVNYYNFEVGEELFSFYINTSVVNDHIFVCLSYGWFCYR